MICAYALKNSHGEVAAFFSDNADAGKRADFIKVFFNNTYTEMILDNRQRAGYVAYDDVLHLWRGAYLSRDQEEYLGWDAVADMISRMMERGQWMEQTVLGVDEPTPEQITIQIDEPAPPEDDHIPNLFDIAGSIPLTNSPAREPVTIKPLVSQDVIDAALTLGANERDSRLRIIAEFMKDKPLEKNTRFLQAHYKENGAGFFVGERKYSLWYDDAGLRIAPGESAKSFTATALDWEQAAVRIRELLDEGKYSSQSMLYHAWPYERQRVADALLLLFRDIDPDYRKEKMPRLEDIQSLRVGYPDMLARLVEKMQQPDELQIFIDEYATFIQDYAHNRKLLLFRHRGADEILQGLEDLRHIPLKFDASPDYTPVERFFISQDEIDRLLREQPDHHEYRIGVVKFFESHPDKKEREKYLGHLHGEYISHGDGHNNVLYTSKQLEFRHGIATNPYAAVKLKWPQVRKRIEELIAHDAFLSAEDREIMESRTLEPEVESATPLDRAKELINDFCQSEFESDADFSDLSSISIAYTTTSDGEHEIQITADLIAYKIVYAVDGQSVYTIQCENLDEMNEYLGNLDLDSMVADAEDRYFDQVPAIESDFPATVIASVPEAESAPSPTVKELHDKYKGQIIEALITDELYRNACRNFDKDSAYIEGNAAIKRVVLAAEDETLTKLYFDNTRFHNDLHRDVLDETYPIFSRTEEPNTTQEEQDAPDENLTDLGKKSLEIAKQYTDLSMQEKIDVIARTFGAKTGHIKTSPCSGKWRGTSDISICFDNDARIFIGNLRTPEAKKAKIQNEYVNYTVTRYNPEIVSLTKETALRALRKREERDNAIAAEKGLKPYTVLNVELCEGINGKESEYIGWYYVTIAVDGKIHAHLETGLNHDISFGKVSEGITRDKYFTAVVLKGMDVDYVFNNVGFSTASRMYSLPLSDAARERAEMMLAQQTSELDIQPSIPMKPAQEIASDVNGKRDPLAPAYKVGDTVYLDNTAFTITWI